MPLCKESHIEVLPFSIDGELSVQVSCRNCHKTIITTEEDWCVIDYSAIKQAVNEHLLETRADMLQLKWQVFRDRIR